MAIGIGLSPSPNVTVLKVMQLYRSGMLDRHLVAILASNIFVIITEKNIDYIEECFKWKLRKIKFSTKNSVDTYLYLFQE